MMASTTSRSVTGRITPSTIANVESDPDEVCTVQNSPERRSAPTGMQTRMHEYAPEVSGAVHWHTPARHLPLPLHGSVPPGGTHERRVAAEATMRPVR